MKIALTADWHLRGKDLAVARGQLDELVERAREAGCYTLIVAGDVFHSPQIGDADASTGEIAGCAVEVLENWNRETILIPGQHDLAGVGSAPAIRALKGLPRVRVWETPTRLDHGGWSAPPVIIAGLPWSWAAAPTAEEELRRIVADGCDLLFGHVQVHGARMGRVACAPKAGEWQVSRDLLLSLPVRYIALGDFHARQALDARGGYVGAIRQLDFGEEGNPAGFEVWDSDINTVEWIELNVAPRYRTVTVQSAEEARAIERRPNERLRIQIEGADPDMADVRAMEADGVRVERILPRVERLARAAPPAGVLNNPRALMDLWADAQTPPVDATRRERMRRLYDTKQEAST